MTSVLRKVADGAAWMVLFKLIERSLGLVSTLILVRLLAPGDFGLVAMAVSVIAMIELLTAFGFDTALIREQQADRTHYDTVWTLGLLVAAFVSTAMIVAAPFAASFYQSPQVREVMYALAAVPLLQAAQNVGVVAFRKELEFRKEFVYQVSKKVAAFCVTIPLAFAIANHWALVAGIVAGNAFACVLSYWLHPFRPRPSLVRFRSLFAFSKWLLLNNLVGYLRERTTDIVVGRQFGPASLGVFSVSYELANLPTSELGAPINRALVPGFSKMSSQPDELQRLYRAALSMLALVAIPASAGIYALSHLIVPVALGPKWLDAVPLMQVLAFQGAILMLHASMWTTLTATGHPRDSFVANLVFVISLGLLLVGLVPSFGIVGAAYATVLAGVASTPAYLWFTWKRLRLSPRWLAHAAWRPLLSAGAMVAVLHWTYPPSEIGATGVIAALRLVGAVATGASVYVATILLLWVAVGRPGGGESMLLDAMRARAGLSARSA